MVTDLTSSPQASNVRQTRHLLRARSALSPGASATYVIFLFSTMQRHFANAWSLYSTRFISTASLDGSRPGRSVLSTTETGSSRSTAGKPPIPGAGKGSQENNGRSVQKEGRDHASRALSDGCELVGEKSIAIGPGDSGIASFTCDIAFTPRKELMLRELSQQGMLP